MIDCVLFDLDGTLADTAPDLAAALNRMRIARGMPDIAAQDLRRHVSAGSPGMLKFGFGIEADSPDFEAYKAEFSNHYASAVFKHSRLFEGIPDVLDQLDNCRRRWGVVTNKATRFAAPLVEGLGLSARAACLVYADTTPYAKPHPAPLLHGAQACGVAAANCVYIGDDLRDIQAGHAAGMRTVAVTWGYANANPNDWGADDVVDRPRDLLRLLA